MAKHNKDSDSVDDLKRDYYYLKMAHKVVEKDHVEFGEDFIALTVMSYMNENMEKYLITPAKQS